MSPATLHPQHFGLSQVSMTRLIHLLIWATLACLACSKSYKKCKLLKADNGWMKKSTWKKKKIWGIDHRDRFKPAPPGQPRAVPSVASEKSSPIQVCSDDLCRDCVTLPDIQRESETLWPSCSVHSVMDIAGNTTGFGEVISG